MPLEIHPYGSHARIVQEVMQFVGVAPKIVKFAAAVFKAGQLVLCGTQHDGAVLASQCCYDSVYWPARRQLSQSYLKIS